MPTALSAFPSVAPEDIEGTTITPRHKESVTRAICFITTPLVDRIIRLERQWRQRTTGLRTNVIVAVGLAGFIMMCRLNEGEGSQGRVAAYLVSGIVGRILHAAAPPIV